MSNSIYGQKSVNTKSIDTSSNLNLGNVKEIFPATSNTSGKPVPLGAQTVSSIGESMLAHNSGLSETHDKKLSLPTTNKNTSNPTSNPLLNSVHTHDSLKADQIQMQAAASKRSGLSSQETNNSMMKASKQNNVNISK